MNRRTFLATLGAFSIPASGGLLADAFAAMPPELLAAQAAGKPILVHVTAPWCGECRRQKPIVADLASRPDFKAMTFINVDFDSQKDVLRSLRVQRQSTLVVYKGDAEVARAVGITKPAAIEALLRKGL